MQNNAFTKLAQRHPEISSHKDLFCYVLAALNWSVAKADGAIQEQEKAAIPPMVDKLGVIKTRNELNSYLCGMRDVINGLISLADILGLIEVFQTQKQRITLLKCLIKVASADGTLDKAEYTIISKVAEAFNFSLPEFGQLAEKLSIETGNAARKRQFEIAGGVLKAVGKSVVVTAAVGAALIAILVRDGNKPAARSSSRATNKVGSSSRDGNRSNQSSESKPEPQFTYRKGGKNCALCRHWYGDRQINLSKKQVLVPLYGQPRGPCAKSPSGKRMVLAKDTCREFESVV